MGERKDPTQFLKNYRFRPARSNVELDIHFVAYDILEMFIQIPVHPKQEFRAECSLQARI